jgi:hypothetical protein
VGLRHRLASGAAARIFTRRSFGGGDDAADQIAGVERGEVDVAVAGDRLDRRDQRGEAMFLVARELFGLLDGRGGMPCTFPPYARSTWN